MSVLIDIVPDIEPIFSREGIKFTYKRQTKAKSRKVEGTVEYEEQLARLQDEMELRAGICGRAKLDFENDDEDNAFAMDIDDAIKPETYPKSNPIDCIIDEKVLNLIDEEWMCFTGAMFYSMDEIEHWRRLRDNSYDYKKFFNNNNIDNDNVENKDHEKANENTCKDPETSNTVKFEGSTQNNDESYSEMVKREFSELFEENNNEIGGQDSKEDVTNQIKTEEFIKSSSGSMTDEGTTNEIYVNNVKITFGTTAITLPSDSKENTDVAKKALETEKNIRNSILELQKEFHNAPINAADQLTKPEQEPQEYGRRNHVRTVPKPTCNDIFENINPGPQMNPLKEEQIDDTKHKEPLKVSNEENYKYGIYDDTINIDSKDCREVIEVETKDYKESSQSKDVIDENNIHNQLKSEEKHRKHRKKKHHKKIKIKNGHVTLDKDGNEPPQELDKDKEKRKESKRNKILAPIITDAHTKEETNNEKATDKIVDIRIKAEEGKIDLKESVSGVIQNKEINQQPMNQNKLPEDISSNKHDTASTVSKSKKKDKKHRHRKDKHRNKEKSDTKIVNNSITTLVEKVKTEETVKPERKSHKHDKKDRERSKSHNPKELERHSLVEDIRKDLKKSRNDETKLKDHNQNNTTPDVNIKTSEEHVKKEHSEGKHSTKERKHKHRHKKSRDHKQRSSHESDKHKTDLTQDKKIKDDNHSKVKNEGPENVKASTSNSQPNMDLVLKNENVIENHRQEDIGGGGNEKRLNIIEDDVEAAIERLFIDPTAILNEFITEEICSCVKEYWESYSNANIATEIKQESPVKKVEKPDDIQASDVKPYIQLKLTPQVEHKNESTNNKEVMKRPSQNETAILPNIEQEIKTEPVRIKEEKDTNVGKDKLQTKDPQINGRSNIESRDDKSSVSITIRRINKESSHDTQINKDAIRRQQKKGDDVIEEELRKLINKQLQNFAVDVRIGNEDLSIFNANTPKTNQANGKIKDEFSSNDTPDACQTSNQQQPDKSPKKERDVLPVPKTETDVKQIQEGSSDAKKDPEEISQSDSKKKKHKHSKSKHKSKKDKERSNSKDKSESKEHNKHSDLKHRHHKKKNRDKHSESKSKDHSKQEESTIKTDLKPKSEPIKELQAERENSKLKDQDKIPKIKESSHKHKSIFSDEQKPNSDYKNPKTEQNLQQLNSEAKNNIEMKPPSQMELQINNRQEVCKPNQEIKPPNDKASDYSKDSKRKDDHHKSKHKSNKEEKTTTKPQLKIIETLNLSKDVMRSHYETKEQTTFTETNLKNKEIQTPQLPAKIQPTNNQSPKSKPLSPIKVRINYKSLNTENKEKSQGELNSNANNQGILKSTLISPSESKENSGLEPQPQNGTKSEPKQNKPIILKIKSGNLHMKSKDQEEKTKSKAIPSAIDKKENSKIKLKETDKEADKKSLSDNKEKRDKPQPNSESRTESVKSIKKTDPVDSKADQSLSINEDEQKSNTKQEDDKKSTPKSRKRKHKSENKTQSKNDTVSIIKEGYEHNTYLSSRIVSEDGHTKIKIKRRLNVEEAPKNPAPAEKSNSNQKIHTSSVIDDPKTNDELLYEPKPKRAKTNKESDIKVPKNDHILQLAPLDSEEKNTRKRNPRNVKKVDNTKKIKCKKCPNKFFVSEADSHVCPPIDPATYCEICDRSYCNKYQLKRHMQTHAPVKKNKDHICQHCDEPFPTQNLLTQHLKTHNNKKQFECSFCGKKFVRKGYWERHENTHRGVKDYECQICDKKFSYRNAYTRHNCQKATLKKYRCPFCPKVFTARENFVNHYNLHTGKDPFKCVECSNIFVSNEHLLLHACIEQNKIGNIIDVDWLTSKSITTVPPKDALNSKESVQVTSTKRKMPMESTGNSDEHSASKKRGLYCEKCNEKFNDITKFNKHMADHNKPMFTCDVCERSFKLKASMVKHMKTHSGADFICKICNKKFSTRQVYKIHILKHSEQNFACEVCEKTFETHPALQIHCRSHSGNAYNCNVCTKSFNDLPSLQRHKITHATEKLFACLCCPKKGMTKSQYQSHLYTHTGETPYICEICTEGFPTKRKMKTHMESCKGD